MTPAFEDDARSSLMRLRGALAELLNQAGADPTRPQDVSRQFDINKNLSWKISRIIQESDPGAMIPHVPGHAGMNIFLGAFEKAGVPDAAIETVRSAINDFERMIRMHSGDRKTFASMLASISDNGDAQQQMEAIRKQTFEGNSAIFGVQALTQLNTTVVAPSETDAEGVDLAMMNGFLNFRRLRSDIAWTIAQRRVMHDDGTPKQSPAIEPLEPPLDEYPDVPLFHSFCSSPFPEIRAVQCPDGVLYHQLQEGPVGKTAAVDCLLAGIVREGGPRFPSEKDKTMQFFSKPCTPVHVFMMDVFVHQDLEWKVPDLGIFNNLPGLPQFPMQGFERGRLFAGERIENLGSRPPVIATSEVPTYSKMIARVFDCIDLDINDFVGYRTILRYPPIPSTVVFRFELPPRP